MIAIVSFTCSDHAAVSELDRLLNLEQEAEARNLVLPRLGLVFEEIKTPAGGLPLITLCPIRALVSPPLEQEHATFARYAGRANAGDQFGGVIAAFQATRTGAGVPVIVTESARVTAALQGRTCRVGVGTDGAPGWSTVLDLPVDAHWELRQLSAAVGGIFVAFADRQVVAPAFFVPGGVRAGG